MIFIIINSNDKDKKIGKNTMKREMRNYVIFASLPMNQQRLGSVEEMKTVWANELQRFWVKKQIAAEIKNDVYFPFG